MPSASATSHARAKSRLLEQLPRAMTGPLPSSQRPPPFLASSLRLIGGEVAVDDDRALGAQPQRLAAGAERDRLLAHRGEGEQAAPAGTLRVALERAHGDVHPDAVVESRAAEGVGRQLDEARAHGDRVAGRHAPLGLLATRGADVEPLVLEVGRVAPLVGRDEVSRPLAAHGGHGARRGVDHVLATLGDGGDPSPRRCGSRRSPDRRRGSRRTRSGRRDRSPPPVASAPSFTSPEHVAEGVDLGRGDPRSGGRARSSAPAPRSR